MGLSRVAKAGLQPHQRKTKRREDLPFFSNDTNSFFSSFPSIVFVAWDQGISIDKLKILRAQRYVFLTHKDVGFFGSCVFFVLSRLLVRVSLILHCQTSSLYISIFSTFSNVI
jgi:hypothetical protein